jgi:hypothetical protein
VVDAGHSVASSCIVSFRNFPPVLLLEKRVNYHPSTLLLLLLQPFKGRSGHRLCTVHDQVVFNLNGTELNNF